jgi:hypothetical protein
MLVGADAINMITYLPQGDLLGVEPWLVSGFVPFIDSPYAVLSCRRTTISELRSDHRVLMLAMPQQTH